ncbi:MAG: carboxypeptidase regulatory-like domain-containing protein [Bacteroidota bacterium]
MKRFLWLRIAFFSVALFSIISFAQAQLMPPIDLRAQVEENSRVELSWHKPFMISDNDISYYKIYRSSTMMGSFTLIDSTRNDEYTDTPPLNASTMWFYYVTAVTRFGETPRSNVAMVNLIGGGNIHGKVEIISRPPKTATVGVLYTYQVQAIARDSSAVLTFYLVRAPAGMTIDSTSGLIQWTPTASGWFEVKVVVRASTGGSDDQEFFIRVAGGTNATVSGTVTDSTGAGIARVLIKLFEINRPHFVYTALTDSSGFYSISYVDAGTYFARAVPLGGGYYPQWYNGARNLRDATPVKVPDSGTVTVNFVLRPYPVPQTYTASGSVTDTAGAAIKDATVFFIRAWAGFSGHVSISGEHNGEMEENDDFNGMHDSLDDSLSSDDSLWGDFSFEHESRFVTKVHVDSLGNYSVKLAAGSYIALAVAPGYAKQFFDHKSNFLEADIIVLTHDTTGINFSLAPVSLALGEIHGQVIDSTTGAGVRARLLAFRDKWRHHHQGEGSDDYNRRGIAFTETDSTGAYAFTNLADGQYIILAVPAGPYAPSFYSTSGTTLRWKDATPVSVNGNVVTGIDIYVKPIVTTSSGFTSINGVVLSGSVGVEGALVFATSINNSTVAGYAVTNAQGAFAINGLAPGTYTVTADKPGYESPSPTTANPGYNPDGSPAPSTANLSLVQTPLSVNDPSTTPSKYILEQNYPNPFNPTTQIVFSLPKNDRVELSIYNIIGQKIATLINGEMSAGTYQITWNATDARGLSVPSGIYFYQLRAGDFTATRKMLLLR